MCIIPLRSGGVEAVALGVEGRCVWVQELSVLWGGGHATEFPTVTPRWAGTPLPLRLRANCFLPLFLGCRAAALLSRGGHGHAMSLVQTWGLWTAGGQGLWSHTAVFSSTKFYKSKWRVSLPCPKSG